MRRSVGAGGLAVPQVREQLVEVGGVKLAGATAAGQRVPVVLRVQDDPAIGRFEDHVGVHDGDPCAVGVGPPRPRPPSGPGGRLDSRGTPAARAGRIR